MSNSKPLEVSVALFHAWFFSNVEKYNSKHLTDGDIASAAGISSPYYSRCKNDRVSLSLNAALKIAEVVGFSIEFKITTDEKET